jgi:D-sedoheptulose 7-phosphate isomerase
MDRLDDYLRHEAELLGRIPRQPLADMATILAEARRTGRRIFIFGNGGSAATASHFVVDLIKGAAAPGKPPFKIVCLNDSIPTLTAVANDYSYESVFATPLAALAEPGDIAIAISGSGNSANVLRAMETARQLKLTSIGLTGFSGGKLKDVVDLAIIVPSESMQLIEDAHLVILHAIFVELCNR